MGAGIQFAGRVWLYYLMTGVLCGMMGVSENAFAIILNLALLAGVCGICLNDGGYRGEKACALNASLAKHQKDGRPIDQAQLKNTWTKSTAYRMLAIVIIPFWLIAAVNIIVNPPRPDMPAVSARAETESALPPPVQPLGDETEESAAASAVTPAFIINTIARLVFIPYNFTYFLLSEVWLYWLFFLYALPFPLAACLGYLNGPKLYDKKIRDMLKGKRRKMRKIRDERRPKQQKPVV
jgi:hypothetical protein